MPVKQMESVYSYQVWVLQQDTWEVGLFSGIGRVSPLYIAASAYQMLYKNSDFWE
jgi:hypothetical protein